MRLVIGLLLSFFSTLISANVWQWSEPCRVDSGQTLCSFWPASISPVSDFKVKANNQLLPSQLISLEQGSKLTASLVFLQANISSSAHKNSLKTALADFVGNIGSHQKVGMYANGETLINISPLGASTAALKSSLSKIAFPNPSLDVVETVGELISILGGAPMQRKSLFWITTGAELSNAEQQVLKEKLQQENVRLVVVYLKTSELDSNRDSIFPNLMQSGGHFQISSFASGWKGLLSQAAKHSVAGGGVVINSEALCGSQNVLFSARIGSSSQTASQTINYDACTSEPIAQTEETVITGDTTEPNSEQQAPTDSSVEPSTEEPEVGTEIVSDLQFTFPIYNFVVDYQTTSNTNLGVLQIQNIASGATASFSINEGNGSDLFRVNPTGELTLSIMGEEIVTDSYDELAEEYSLTVTATTESQSGQAVVSVRKAQLPFLANTKLIIILSGGMLLLLGLVFLLFRNKAKTRDFATLIEYSPQGEIRHPLVKPATKLGRETENDIVLQNDTVSGSHAVIKYGRDGSITLVDLDSTNGTRVNEEFINQVVVKSEDIIELGEYRLRLEVKQ